MKVYISGKIGKDHPSPETLAKFKEAEDMLKGKGHEVFNPTTSGLGRHAESLAQAADYETSFYQEILLLTLCSCRSAMPSWYFQTGIGHLVLKLKCCWPWRCTSPSTKRRQTVVCLK